MALMRLDPSHPGHRLNGKHAALMGASLALCRRLQQLHLQRVPGLDDAVVGALCAAFKTEVLGDGSLSRSLAWLSLDGNGLTDVSASALASAVKKGAFHALSTLSLGHNRLSADGLRELCRSSRRAGGVFGRLRELYLHHNGFGDEGAQALATELGKGALKGLYALYLGANKIGDDGCRSLCNAARAGALQTLNCLHLYQNNITREGAVACGKALHEWALRNLSQLVLDGNKAVTERAQRFVIDALRRREWARNVLLLWREWIRRRKIRRADTQQTNKLERTVRKQQAGARRVMLPVIAQWRTNAVVSG
jgi:Ran GTPase-activating protein (RanGAP) involved in mRNA processing and transport